jgi:hypothetical protein
MTLKQLKSSYADLLLQIDATSSRKEGLQLIRQADKVLTCIHLMEEKQVLSPSWQEILGER